MIPTRAVPALRKSPSLSNSLCAERSDASASGKPSLLNSPRPSAELEPGLNAGEAVLRRQCGGFRGGFLGVGVSAVRRLLGEQLRLERGLTVADGGEPFRRQLGASTGERGRM